MVLGSNRRQSLGETPNVTGDSALALSVELLGAAQVTILCHPAARDPQRVLVVQLHNNGGPLTFTAEAHTEVVEREETS